MSKNYVEVARKDEKNLLRTKEYEIEERNPLNVPEGCYWFRYFEMDEKGEKTNFSSKYYVGKRIKAEEIFKRSEEYPYDELYAFLEFAVLDGNLSSVVIADDHTVMCCREEEGITIDEYALMMSNNYREKNINRKHFFQGIASVLNKYEKDNYKLVEKVDSFIGENRSEVRMRDYSIVRNNDIIASDCRMTSFVLDNEDRLSERFSLDKYISCVEAELPLLMLYDEYKYLEPLVERIKIEAVKSKGKIINRDIIKIAEELIKEKTEDFARTLKK